MESLFNFVLNAEHRARSQKAKARTLRKSALCVQTTVGHAYIFLNRATQRVDHVIYVYQHEGKFIVPTRSLKYCCDTLTEAEGHLHDWAVRNGMIG